MKFINTGTILISTNTIKTIEVVGTRAKGEYAVYINGRYEYNPDHNEKMTLTEAEYIMDNLIAELEAE